MSDLPKLISVTQQEITALKEQYDLFRLLQKEVLEADVDYGFPHGKREGKPSLYKSGAEKLTRLFNLIPHFELLKAIEEENYVYYMFKATLTTASAQVVGEGFGSCNSKEKRHWSDNPLGNANTILKMAKKRAHVDAVLTGLGASNVFTQDLEDMETTEAEQKPTQQTQKQELATEKQNKMITHLIHDLAKEAECSVEEIVADIKQRYGVQSSSELTKAQASKLIDELQTLLSETRSQDGDSHE